MESDADRLERVKALGGLTLKIRGNEFVAIFEAVFVETGDMESVDPFLTIRTSDVARVFLQKDDVLNINGEIYRVRRHEPDGAGMSKVVLRR